MKHPIHYSTTGDLPSLVPVFLWVTSRGTLHQRNFPTVNVTVLIISGGGVVVIFTRCVLCTVINSKYETVSELHYFAVSQDEISPIVTSMRYHGEAGGLVLMRAQGHATTPFTKCHGYYCSITLTTTCFTLVCWAVKNLN